MKAPDVMASNNYIAEVDGLRALAVLAVVLFHVGFDGFSGGYVGVDIFFVISGFLITRLIMSEVAQGKFRFSNFYVRRARRLLPALFVTLAGTYSVAALLFTPSELERTAGAGMHAAISFSNIFFWLESGYFDASSDVKPFLHTWSLSVEEQFYFLWPALTVGLLARLKKWTALAVVTILGIISLAASEYFLPQTPAAVFFLTPFRICEFAIGAGLAVGAGKQSQSTIKNEAAMLVGYGLMFYAILEFTDETRFPGLTAMIPALGTGLAIYGCKAKYLAAPLRHPWMVWLGLASYSLYLIHWPIIVFTKYLVGQEINFATKISIVAASIIIAGLMARFVEKPFRRPASNRNALSPPEFALVCALCVIGLVTPMANAWAQGGWAWRFGDTAANYDLEELRLASLQSARTQTNNVNFTIASNRILVVGDSHAGDTANGLAFARDKASQEVLLQALDDNCAFSLIDQTEKISESRRGVCARQIELFQYSLKAQSADLIIFSALWTEETISLLPALFDLARQTSNNPKLQIVVLGLGDRFLNFQRDVLRMLLDGRSIKAINNEAFNRRWASADRLNERIINIAEQHNVIYLSRHDIVCGVDSCDFVLDGNVPAFWDHTHWTNNGARLFGERLMRKVNALNDDDVAAGG